MSQEKKKTVGSKQANGNKPTPEWQGNVTCLAAISTARRSMPPCWFIIEGLQQTQAGLAIMAEMKANGNTVSTEQFIMAGKTAGGKNSKGGMSHVIWEQYFKTVLLPNLSNAEKQNGALVIVDGHESHFEFEVILW